MAQVGNPATAGQKEVNTDWPVEDKTEMHLQPEEASLVPDRKKVLM